MCIDLDITCDTITIVRRLKLIYIPILSKFKFDVAIIICDLDIKQNIFIREL